MKPIPPALKGNQQRVIFAENQEEYEPLPGVIDEDGVLVTEWELSPEEFATLQQSHKIRLSIMTFGKPLQPVLMEVVNDELPDV